MSKYFYQHYGTQDWFPTTCFVVEADNLEAALEQVKKHPRYQPVESPDDIELYQIGDHIEVTME